ncbi:uncharacterized protein BO87DRAFT_402153 [Aspergillus neoniger CBS 115656]|uniref:Rhodopsin domain-containing protein n=1 Tax=Aspergillus neoniger (strain CBS 115656) TaxID=1448310 RepID=A0A318Y2H5_ASPNB|nr:hypothetical protein BO87DRAFT_402153 [Aspergillus neoniger CBS 115656]PYH28536.1 hypothetical protein BO87DRAFT_402153 [Aspergillus neoniger CBS 115656]
MITPLIFPRCTQHQLSRNIEADKGQLAIFGQPPAHIDLAESQVRRDNAAVIVLLLLSIIAVGLRFIARLAVRNPFRLDDWLILASLAFVAATAGLSLAGGAFDAGKHVWAESLADVSTIFKILLTYTFMYAAGCSAYKLSILFFYRRIFVVVHQPLSLRISVLIGFVLALSYPVIVWVAMGNCCQPLSYFWNQFQGASGTCIDTDTFFLATGIINMLQMNRRKKIAVYLILALGSFVCVASAVRIYVLYRFTHAHDITWMMGPLFICSSIEPSVAIVCACLPHLTRIRILCSQGSKGNQFPFSVSPRKPSRHHGDRAHLQASIRLGQPRRVRTLTSTCGVPEDEVGLANLGMDDMTAQHTPSLRSTSEYPIPDHSIVVRSSLAQSVSYR